MATINPYLTFNGNCEEAFTFYKSVFGGEFPFMGKFKDMPPVDGCGEMSVADQEKVMHVSLPISGETILMGSDNIESFGRKIIDGNNFAISINTNSREEADKLFAGLSADGQVTMPMNKSFWGAYFGMFTDKFGIQWMVNFDETPKA